MNTPSLREQCAQHLLASQSLVENLTAFVGLDGFVDEIIHVVDKRENAESFHRLPTIRQFSERLAQAAGKSTNIELVTQKVKLGGNGPIMANALAHLGLKTTYVGNVGYPNIHPVFADFATRAEVVSIADPCHTDALEFEDGKIMLGKSVQLNDITWENIQRRFGRDRFCQKFSSADIVSFVNWTMIPYMSELWESLLLEICPDMRGTRRRKIFFDLADPAKRSSEDIQRALSLISRFENYFDVIFGLNEKEAFEVGEVLGIPVPSDRSPESVAQLAGEIYGYLRIHTLAVHPITYALAVTDGKTDLVEGPHIAKPLITTGAGDHFNAGFCLGKLLKMDNASCVLLGVASSGYYVRTAQSATVPALANMLRHWPTKQQP